MSKDDSMVFAVMDALAADCEGLRRRQVDEGGYLLQVGNTPGQSVFIAVRGRWQRAEGQPLMAFVLRNLTTGFI